METTAAHPLEAASVPELLTLQIREEHPTGTIAAVARYIGVKETTLYAYVADPSATNHRLPEPATLRDLLTQLRATPEVIERAMRLWAAAKGAA